MIRYYKHAQKFIDSQESKNAMRIVSAIEKLPAGDVVRVKSSDVPPLNRLRVGRYRIFSTLKMK